MTIALSLAALVSCNSKHWVGSWATALQVAEPHNCPPEPGLEGNSIRQIVELSVGGDCLRVKLSNEFGTEPVEIEAASIAPALSAGGSPDIDEAASAILSFGGEVSVVIAPGELVVSDPVKMKLQPRADLAITLQLGKASSTVVTSHPGSRTTSYIAKGHTNDFSAAVRTDHWYIINAVEVLSDAQAIVILGDSITDGRGSTHNVQNRWSDNLSRLLLSNGTTSSLSVLNMGVGGGCVLRGGLGVPATLRYPRDLFGQEGVGYIILYEGVNDILGSFNPEKTARDIIDFYTSLTAEAHIRGIKVLGATIAPFMGNGPATPEREQGRLLLNEWILSCSDLDGVVDFASAVCSPGDPSVLDERYLYENDYLHLNADGYKVMGEVAYESVLRLFEKREARQVSAATLQVGAQPTPAEISLSGRMLWFPEGGYVIKAVPELASADFSALTALLPVDAGGSGEIRVTKGPFAVSVSPRGIDLSMEDAASLERAAQILGQLVRGASIAEVKLKD